MVSAMPFRMAPTGSSSTTAGAVSRAWFAGAILTARVSAQLWSD